MSYLDTYYRALIDYRKNTTHDKDCGSQRTATVKANAKGDNIVLTRKICHVHTDWIEHIEQGLEHVDKAIREERQFIRSNGEVVDIEKVRSVSKDSVKHLAEHSNLITRYTEGEDVVPDRLYVVERLNDYAVYENRFLYMMLCYLRDFITVRYNKILELEHTYNAAMAMNKKIEMPKRQITLDISLQETKNDDPFLMERSESKDVIARIRDILEYVHAFLNTPLMEEVSKVPMIKPPITKTNVLRMNNNFRGALALYEYVAAYEGDGYTVEEKVQKIQPFRIDMADEFSEIVLLSSFLTYQHGMGVKAALQQAYEAEEERRRLEQEQKLVEQIRALRRRIAESGESPEEYMLMLERRNRTLEADSEQLKIANQKIEELEERNETLTKENTGLTEKVAALSEKIEAIEIEHKAEIDRLNAAFEQKIADTCAKYEQKIADVCAQYEQRIDDLHRAQADEIQKLEEAFGMERAQLLETMQTAEMVHQQEMADALEAHTLELRQHTDYYNNSVAELTARYETETTSLKVACEEECTRMRNACADSNVTILSKTRENEQLAAKQRLAEARLLALRRECGLITEQEEFTTKESFEELEHQYEVFKSLFNEEWKKAKRQIRKQTFQSYKDAIKEGRTEEFRSQLDKREEEMLENNAMQTEAPDVAAQEDEAIQIAVDNMNDATVNEELQVQLLADEMQGEALGEETQVEELSAQDAAATDEVENAADVQVDAEMLRIEALMAEFTQRCQTELDGVSAIHVNELEALRAAWNEERDRLYHRYSEMNAMWKTESDRLQGACDEKDLVIESKTRENERLEAARRLAEARMLAMRKGCGMITDADDFTSKETFEELEHQYEIFKALFGNEWKKAKRQIRKNAFQIYNEEKEREVRAKLADYGVSDGNVTLDPALVEEVLAEKEEIMKRNEALSAMNAENDPAEASALENAEGAQDIADAQEQASTVVPESEQADACTEADQETVEVEPAAEQQLSKKERKALLKQQKLEKKAEKRKIKEEQKAEEAANEAQTVQVSDFGEFEAPTAEAEVIPTAEAVEEPIVAEEVQQEIIEIVTTTEQEPTVAEPVAEQETAEAEPVAEQQLSKKERKALLKQQKLEKKAEKRKIKEEQKAEEAANEAQTVQVSDFGEFEAPTAEAEVISTAEAVEAPIVTEEVQQEIVETENDKTQEVLNDEDI